MNIKILYIPFFFNTSTIEHMSDGGNSAYEQQDDIYSILKQVDLNN